MLIGSKKIEKSTSCGIGKIVPEVTFWDRVLPRKIASWTDIFVALGKSNARRVGHLISFVVETLDLSLILILFT